MATILEQLIDLYPEEEFLKADGYDEAIIGYDMRHMRLVYDMTLCINLLIDRDGMTEEDALEHFHYNTLGSLGDEERYPLFIDIAFDK
jgi:hypothetical protein